VIILNDFTNALENIRNGKIIIKKQFLQELGLFKKICDLTPQIRKFEKLHEELTAQQIYNLNIDVSAKIPEIGYQITRTFVKDYIGYKDKFYIDNAPVIRFYVPHDFYKANEAVLKDRQGYLRIQGPHHDTWFGHAIEGLNLWMAIGRVKKGNGLSLYPETWGKYIEHNGNFQMPRDQYLGPSLNFELDPGDLLFFHGEFVHASELNVTDETRYVITTRFSTEPPIFKEGGNSPWIPCEQ